MSRERKTAKTRQALEKKSLRETTRKKKKKSYTSPAILKLSERQRRYRTNRLKGMNQYNAAVAAGYSRTTAWSKSYAIERAVKQSIIEELEQAGCTDKWLAKELHRLASLSERLEMVQMQRVEVDQGNKKATQVRREFMRVPDNSLRLQALEVIARLKKQLTNNPILDNSERTFLTIVVEKEAAPEDKGRDGLRDSVRTDKTTVVGVALTD